MSKMWKFFGLLAIALAIIYFVAQWYVGTSGATWLVPKDYVMYGAIGSGVIAVLCFVLKK